MSDSSAQRRLVPESLVVTQKSAIFRALLSTNKNLITTLTQPEPAGQIVVKPMVRAFIRAGARPVLQLYFLWNDYALV
ncbi:hypothetical protein LZ24_01448 [Desulfobotulus alkaliphilus]|uniref:Uncharacterized protein n=1 Tax=Desulfobotulus alkaliphilus TaxID=622671 RepID=A0A562RVE1_9BACT|nr:hypothetical protein [Desulfobotulus alkaliphilus]TWI73037.1 hypothetical protein LZ24_01448 [Desulfobotulus alkaliphilus]